MLISGSALGWSHRSPSGDEVSNRSAVSIASQKAVRTGVSGDDRNHGVWQTATSRPSGPSSRAVTWVHGSVLAECKSVYPCCSSSSAAAATSSTSNSTLACGLGTSSGQLSVSKQALAAWFKG